MVKMLHWLKKDQQQDLVVETTNVSISLIKQIENVEECHAITLKHASQLTQKQKKS